ncbi:hypothetical protein EC991_006381 [Linnemannia zychae]|nr:hypothetical protein EC991_006381 [Linnemannia zychae]
MADHLLEQLRPQPHKTSTTVSTVSMKISDKIRTFLRILKPKPKSQEVESKEVKSEPKSKEEKSKPKSKEVELKARGQSLNTQPPSQQSTRPRSIVSQATTHPLSYNPTVSSPSVVQQILPHPSPQSSQLTSAQAVIDVLPGNVLKSTVKPALPCLQGFIEDTAQLIYCNSLPLQDVSPLSAIVTGEQSDNGTILALQDSTLDNAELNWMENAKIDSVNQGHLNFLFTRMDEFIAETTKDSIEISEIGAPEPVLQSESFLGLMSWLIKNFDDSHLLDVNPLQCLVVLLQCARYGALVFDVVKILITLLFRLEGTHHQSTRYYYRLTEAVSEVLNVMADRNAQSPDRILEHEPLSGILSELYGSSDLYLKYELLYASVVLLHTPYSDPNLQAVLRYSIHIASSLFKIAAMFKLDQASILDFLSNLQESAGGVIEAARTVYEVLSLIENGSNVYDRKGGSSTSHKPPWYLVIEAVYAFSQAGQLMCLKQLILEAPCRRDPIFQRVICQLLGDVAFDPVWNVSIRHQSISFINWGRYESAKACILTNITTMGGNFELSVIAVGNALMQYFKDKRTLTKRFYPSTVHLPFPASFLTINKRHSFPPVEYDVHKLILQRLIEVELPVYIPPMAKASLEASGEVIFPLMDKVQEFLVSDRQVMLILGDSGGGKSTFSKHLESFLLRSYTRGGRIPLYINLPAIERPDEDFIAEQLRAHNFSKTQIEELRQRHQFIAICDGYNESHLTINLHTSNMLNRPGQWKVKLVISCRSQYLCQDYRAQFVPQGGGYQNRPAPDLFQEAVIVPFSKEQIQDYVEQYASLKSRSRTTQDYMYILTTIPNLMDLVRNPLLLSISLESLPKVTEGNSRLSTIKITRVQLYDIFVDRCMYINEWRLRFRSLIGRDRSAFGDLLNADFLSTTINNSIRLASAIFEQQGGNPVVHYVHHFDKETWKAEFFGPNPKTRLLRASMGLSHANSLFQFHHQSLLEYFLSCAVFDPRSYGGTNDFSTQPSHCSKVALSLDPHGPLFKQNLLTEPLVIQFLRERVSQHPHFKNQLFAIIEQSKTDATSFIAASNAIGILNQSNTQLNNINIQRAACHNSTNTEIGHWVPITNVGNYTGEVDSRPYFMRNTLRMVDAVVVNYYGEADERPYCMRSTSSTK